MKMAKQQPNTFVEHQLTESFSFDEGEITKILSTQLNPSSNSCFLLQMSTLFVQSVVFY